MRSTLATLLSAFAVVSIGYATPIDERATCSNAQKQAAIAAEIKTIGSHSAADAAKIPLAPLASRTFYITPAELGGKVTLPPVNVGVTAATIRDELVVLATILNAGVPPNSVHYISNANGSMTVDFVQTDRIVLPDSQVREIHYFDSNCLITEIVGFVNGPLICPTTSTNAVLTTLCTEYAAAKAAA